MKGNNLFNLIVAIGLVFQLAGCGGGGSSTGTNNGAGDDQEQEQVERVSLTGLAIKGLMMGAQIQISNLSGSEIYGSTTTDNFGQYSLDDISLPEGPLLATMTTLAGTTTICDSATGCNTGNDTRLAFGETYAFNDPDFFMTAVLPGYESGATDEKLMITSVTHLATRRALSSGASTSDDIKDINSATATLLGLGGVDINALAPSIMTDESLESDGLQAQEYGAITAAFASLADSKGISVAEVLDQVSSSYAEKEGLIANSSDETVIDLGDIFESASAVVDAAEASGFAVDPQVGLSLQNEAVDANGTEQDMLVSAPIESGDSSTDTSTQTAATQAGIDLLLALNDWYDALFGESAQSITQGYQDEVEAALDMVPAIEEQAESIRGIRELVVDDQNDSEPGSLLEATTVIAQLADLAGWLYANQEILDNSIDDEGYHSESIAELLGNNADLSILGFLRTSDTGNVLTGDLTVRYKLDTDENLLEMTVTGIGAKAEITDSSVKMSNTGTSELTFSIATLKISGEESEEFSGTGTMAILFDEEADRTRYVTEHNSSDDLNIQSATIDIDASIAGITSTEGDSNFARAYSQIEADLSTVRSNGTDLASELVVNITQTHKIGDELQDDQVTGKLTINVNHSLAESSSVEDFLSGGNWSSQEMDFSGEIIAVSESEEKASFDGEISLLANSIEDEISQEMSLAFKGELALTESDHSTSFTGELSVKAVALKDVTDALIYDGDDPWYMISEVDLAGYLTIGDGTTTDAGTSVSGVLRQTNLDKLTALVSFTSLPEFDSILASITYNGYDISTNADANTAVVQYQHDAATVLGQNLVTQLEETGLSSLQLTQDIGLLDRMDFELSNCTLKEADNSYSICDASVGLISINGHSEYLKFDYELPTSNTQEPDIWSESLFEALSNYLTGDNQLSASAYLNIEALQGSASAYIMDGRRLDEYGDDTTPVSIGIPIVNSYTKDYQTIIEDLESESLYIGMGTSLNVSFLSTQFEDAKVQTIVTRNSINDLETTVRLSYGNQTIQLTADTSQDWTDSTVNLVEITDGSTTMLISATCAHSDGDFSGTDLYDCDGDLDVAGEIFVGDFQIGTLESRDDLPVFVFEDGDDYQILITPAFLVEAVQ